MIPFGTRLFSRRAGMAPGTLFHDLEVSGKIELCRYDESGVVEDRFVDKDDLPVAVPEGSFVWIRVKGISDASLLKAVGDAYGIHSLVQEDIQNVDRRPSFGALDEGLFLTAKRLEGGGGFPSIRVETVGLVLLDRTVLTFHEADGKGFPAIQSTLESSAGMRVLGADYLAYRLWDECIDSWLSVAESLEQHVMDLEEKILFRYAESLAGEIHGTRKLMAWLRWEFRPYRDLPLWMARNAADHFSEGTLPFLQDLVDHAARVSDLLDLYRDLSGDLMSVMMSVQSNRMNAVMKVLTLIATLFMPLSFIAGVYGMNFQLMPELAWRWGYPAALGLMGLTAGGMALYFKVKKWF